ncbi:MAG: DUF533 domain-containing protein [Hyphomicrobiaceae bacterium]
MFDAKKILDGLVAGVAGNDASKTPDAPSGGTAGDLLGGIVEQLKKAAADAKARTDEAGGVGNVARSVFGQASEGVKDAAGRIERETGAGKALDDLVRQMSGGRSAGDLFAQVKDLAAKNPAAAGAVAAGLGALILGTRTGRGLTVDAAKLGGLVLIGDLAWKAWANHQAGKPMLDLGRGAGAPEAAPAGSGFDAAAQSSEQALRYVRAMIAAAAADGTVDADEQATHPRRHARGRSRCRGGGLPRGGVRQSRHARGPRPRCHRPRGRRPGLYGGAHRHRARHRGRAPLPRRLAAALRLPEGLADQIDAAARACGPEGGHRRRHAVTRGRPEPAPQHLFPLRQRG